MSTKSLLCSETNPPTDIYIFIIEVILELNLSVYADRLISYFPCNVFVARDVLYCIAMFSIALTHYSILIS